MYPVKSVLPHSPKTVVLGYINFINRRDLEGMAALLSRYHALVVGGVPVAEQLKEALQHWRRFFMRSPDYRMEVVDVEYLGDAVFVVGYECQEGDRRIPTTWFARVLNNLITEWRVYTEKEAPPSTPDKLRSAEGAC